jgi:hypothetical protein
MTFFPLFLSPIALLWPRPRWPRTRPSPPARPGHRRRWLRGRAPPLWRAARTRPGRRRRWSRGRAPPLRRAARTRPGRRRRWPRARPTNAGPRAAARPRAIVLPFGSGAHAHGNHFATPDCGTALGTGARLVPRQRRRSRCSSCSDSHYLLPRLPLHRLLPIGCRLPSLSTPSSWFSPHPARHDGWGSRA